MPVKRFWLFDKNVPRIEATEHMQTLDLIVASRDQKTYKEMHMRLKEQIGTIAMEAPKLDSKGLDGLRNMM